MNELYEIVFDNKKKYKNKQEQTHNLSKFKSIKRQIY